MKQSKKAEKLLESRRKNYESGKLESRQGYHKPGACKRKK